jgi:hypothetical protein
VEAGRKQPKGALRGDFSCNWSLVAKKAAEDFRDDGLDESYLLYQPRPRAGARTPPGGQANNET